MSDIVEKTKQLISSPSQEEGIKGLIKLQAEAPEKMKHIPRLACLSLMQMGHDWQNIRKFIVEWKLISKFGKDLVIRMRKRIGEDPGTISDDNQIILKELDRLNDKNWRQFSPKKNFPDYTEIVNKNNSKETKISFGNVNIGNPPLTKQQKPKKQSLEKQVPNEGGGIFSRLSQIQKNDRNSQKQITSRGVFSKQFFMKSQLSSDKPQVKNEKPERQPILKQRSKDPMQPKTQQGQRQQIKKIDGVNSLLRKIQPVQPRQTTPSKQAPKKIISLKYGNERDKGKQDTIKDEFSFSAVKSRQVQALSNKKQLGPKGDQFNDSFLNFTNDSKNSRVKGQEYEQKNENILEDAGLDRQFLKSNNSRFRQNKNLYTEQELGLIEMQIPAKNYIKTIIKAEGKSGIDMLKNRLCCN